MVRFSLRMNNLRKYVTALAVGGSLAEYFTLHFSVLLKMKLCSGQMIQGSTEAAVQHRKEFEF